MPLKLAALPWLATKAAPLIAAVAPQIQRKIQQLLPALQSTAQKVAATPAVQKVAASPALQAGLRVAQKVAASPLAQQATVNPIATVAAGTLGKRLLTPTQAPRGQTPAGPTTPQVPAVVPPGTTQTPVPRTTMTPVPRTTRAPATGTTMTPTPQMTPTPVPTPGAGTAYPPAQTPPQAPPPLAEEEYVEEENVLRDIPIPDFAAQRDELFGLIDAAAERDAVLISGFMSQMSTQFAETEARIMTMYEEQGMGIDPATRAALAEIRQQIEGRRQALNEEMNRRGLLQSGIWLEMEDRLLNNQLTAEERVLAERLADIQNRMTDSLMQLATQRMNMMGRLGEQQIEGQRQFGAERIRAMGDIHARQNQWNQWWGTLTEQRRQTDLEARGRRDALAEDRRQAAVREGQWGQQFTREGQQWTAEQEREREKAAQDEAYRRADLAERRRQADLAARTRAAGGQAAAGANRVTQEVIATIAGLPNREAALTAFQQDYERMIKLGVDVERVLAEIMKLPPAPAQGTAPPPQHKLPPEHDWTSRINL